MKNEANGTESKTTSNVITYFFKLSPLTSSIHGVFIVKHSEIYINSNVNSYSKTSNGYIYIVNSEGTIITYPKDKNVGQSVAKNDYFKNISTGTTSGKYYRRRVGRRNGLYIYKI